MYFNKQNMPLQFENFIKNNLFSKLFGITVFIGIIPFFLFDKSTMVLAINRTIANDALDVFFKYYTNTALGGTFVIIAIIYFCISKQKGIIVSVSGILILLTSIICKQILFQDFPRPTAEIPLSDFSHIIPDFEYAKRFSFPSGHTMSAFGMATVLSFLISNKSIQILLFVYAISIAFSRMYLLQHFYMDVYAGAIIGYGIVAITIYGLSKFKFQN